MNTLAVVLAEPERLGLDRLELSPPGDADVVVDIEWSGISTGTERLLWSGRMPHFPGMGYPLVPGYESVGRVQHAGPRSGREVGERVFVPGARCFGEVRGLFGGAASRVVVPGMRVVPVDERLGEQAVLLALAATAYHAIAGSRPAAQSQPDVTAGADRVVGSDLIIGPALSVGPELIVGPDLIIGHGVLGRLLARLAVQAGGEPPLVWERNPQRAQGAQGYRVLDPADDPRRDYRAIYDVSGDAALLDELIGRLAPGGEIVLAGFYSEPLSFAFPPAFMREARIRVAAQWREPDLVAVNALAESGRLKFDGLITHREQALAAPAAYRTAFSDPACLKMILDWRACA